MPDTSYKPSLTEPCLTDVVKQEGSDSASDVKQEGSDSASGVRQSSGTADHIMQFFKFEHLPSHLQEISKPFSNMALWIMTHLPRNPERSVALRKLLEAKDAAVRAVVTK